MFDNMNINENKKAKKQFTKKHENCLQHEHVNAKLMKTEIQIRKMKTEIQMKKKKGKNDKHNERTQELSQTWKNLIFLETCSFSCHVFSLKRTLNFGAPWSWGSAYWSYFLRCCPNYFFLIYCKMIRRWLCCSVLALSPFSGSLHNPWQIFWDGFRLLADGACDQHRWLCWSRWWSSEYFGKQQTTGMVAGCSRPQWTAAIKGDW